MNKSSAFTLLELLVVVMIIAILSTMLMPSFQKAWLKSYRSLATQTLYKIALWQEQQLALTGEYQNTLPDNFSKQTASRYQLSLEVKTHAQDSEDYFKITAEAISTQTKDTECRTFSLDTYGETLALDSNSAPTPQCWR
ncbi:type IV pilin protein [Thalassotalea sp. PS06]|uniref:type IV pilin protein n=1 Tax=Thalassotalea sp. PS06 TaxID=2594005 RepID=UPI0011623DD2|nr:type IV pilin protein [Thalassotalea sp. PS06]QDP03006.1 prepilin-type N-terminal cleavage/methylation domain-containing protein [Thalassotalea sp. PS06]